MKIGLTSILVLIVIFTLKAQSINPQLVASSGSTFVHESVQLDWSLGEIAITTLQSSEVVLTQGFHQVYLDRIDVHLRDLAFNNINLYPNPTTDHLIIDFGEMLDQEIIVYLHDFTGKSVSISKLEAFSDSRLIIDLAALPSGQYTISLKASNEVFNVYKIQKIK